MNKGRCPRLPEWFGKMTSRSGWNLGRRVAVWVRLNRQKDQPEEKPGRAKVMEDLEGSKK